MRVSVAKRCLIPDLPLRAGSHRTWALLLSVSALSGCGAQAREPAAGSCANGVRFDSRLYLHAGVQAQQSRRVGEGEGNCDDDPVRVTRIRDVPPELAVGVAGRDGLYVARGYLIALRENPLHDRFFEPGEPARPPAEECGKSVHIGGRVRTQPLIRPSFELSAGGRRWNTHVHLDTRVLGGRTFLRRGARADVDGRVCSDPEGGRRLVADAIRLG
jgi:hypothetical protein